MSVTPLKAHQLAAEGELYSLVLCGNRLAEKSPLAIVQEHLEEVEGLC